MNKYDWRGSHSISAVQNKNAAIAATPLSSSLIMVGPPIDIVIPFHPKDTDILPYCITGIRKYMADAGTIYVVSAERPELDDDFVWIPETDYPFSKDDVAAALPAPAAARAGWYLQQFLKLYAARVIPGLSSEFCIIDSECVFVRPIQYRDASGTLLFDCQGIQNPPYFVAIERLLPGETCIDCGQVGTVDHMIYSQPILEQLLGAIEARCVQKQPAWKAILQSVDPQQAPHSGFSEQELYFHYALKQFPGRYILAPLKRSFGSQMNELTRQDVDILTFHAWYRAT